MNTDIQAASTSLAGSAGMPGTVMGAAAGCAGGAGPGAYSCCPPELTKASRSAGFMRGSMTWSALRTDASGSSK